MEFTSQFLLSLSGLTSGKWIVNIGLRLKTAATLQNAFWIHAKVFSNSLAFSNSGFNNLGPAGNNTGYSSVIYGDGSTSGKEFLAGTTINRSNVKST